MRRDLYEATFYRIGLVVCSVGALIVATLVGVLIGLAVTR